MRKQLIAMVCLLLGMAAGAHAASHWTVNPHNYQYDMTVYAVLTIGGHALTDYSDYELAAFCSEECRGVAKVQTASDGSKYLYLRVYSNVTADETISFCVYQSSTNQVTGLEESIAFEASSMAGTPGEPIALVLSNILKGDVNGDGDVDIADAVCIMNYVVGKPNTTFIEAAADANGDGDIDIADAVHIVNYVVGKIPALAPRFEWNLPEPE